MHQEDSERLGSLLREAHHRVEAGESSRISQAEMATRLGISVRTYLEYLQGRGPVGARAVLELLSMLEDHEAISILHRWRGETRHNEQNDK